MTELGRRSELRPGERRGDVRSVHASGTPGRPAYVELAGHNCGYEVRAGRTIGGPVLLDLRVVPLDGGQITADDLHAIPVRRLAAAAVELGLVFPSDDAVPDTGPSEVDWSRFSQPEKPTRRRAGRPPTHSPEHFAQVADLARQARASGQSARRAIAERWTVGQPTADKWMRQARELGLLELHTASAAAVRGGAPTDSAAGEVAP
ncbi:hypothetical protein [Rhodococcus sp. YL-1]|uniref:hypothetical protein n=2 Tax=unclassified Rhodococcus (in: high G+C Gram-positive bacteria) TaxID=192944 RepID=UPI0012F51DFE|nr:hypothetical protein [Rhodococcus sp. YL-1]